MHFVGQDAGTEVDFLFASWASANFVSLSFAKLHNLVTKTCLVECSTWQRVDGKAVWEVFFARADQ